MPDDVKAVVIKTELADQEPLTTRIYKAIAPHVLKYPVGLEVVGMDVQYSSYSVNGVLVTGYAFLLTVKGALMGAMHHITNTHVIPPFVPNEEQAREMVHVSTSRLREARMEQIRQAMGGNSSG